MFLTILSFNLKFNFSELSFSSLKAWILLQINNYFSKVDLQNIRNKNSEKLLFSKQYETVSETCPEPSQTSKMELPENSLRLIAVNNFRKNLHYRCSTMF